MARFVAIALTGLLIATSAVPAVAQAQRSADATATRQRIVVTPGRTTPGPNSTRECQARLVQQNRPSGTVIVPVMNCWWQ